MVARTHKLVVASVDPSVSTLRSRHQQELFTALNTVRSSARSLAMQNDTLQNYALSLLPSPYLDKFTRGSTHAIALRWNGFKHRKHTNARSKRRYGKKTMHRARRKIERWIKTALVRAYSLNSLAVYSMRNGSLDARVDYLSSIYGLDKTRSTIATRFMSSKQHRLSIQARYAPSTKRYRKNVMNGNEHRLIAKDNKFNYVRRVIMVRKTLYDYSVENHVQDTVFATHTNRFVSEKRYLVNAVKLNRRAVRTEQSTSSIRSIHHHFAIFTATHKMVGQRRSNVCQSGIMTRSSLDHGVEHGHINVSYPELGYLPMLRIYPSWYKINSPRHVDQSLFGVEPPTIQFPGSSTGSIVLTMQSTMNRRRAIPGQTRFLSPGKRMVLHGDVSPTHTLNMNLLHSREGIMTSIDASSMYGPLGFRHRVNVAFVLKLAASIRGRVGVKSKRKIMFSLAYRKTRFGSNRVHYRKKLKTSNTNPSIIRMFCSASKLRVYLYVPGNQNPLRSWLVQSETVPTGYKSTDIKLSEHDAKKHARVGTAGNDVLGMNQTVEQLYNFCKLIRFTRMHVYASTGQNYIGKEFLYKFIRLGRGRNTKKHPKVSSATFTVTRAHNGTKFSGLGTSRRGTSFQLRKKWKTPFKFAQLNKHYGSSSERYMLTSDAYLAGSTKFVHHGESIMDIVKLNKRLVYAPSAWVGKLHHRTSRATAKHDGLADAIGGDVGVAVSVVNA